MNSSQKKVAIGAGSGVISMAILVYFFYSILPDQNILDTTIDKLVFALKMNVFSILPFFVMIIVVANSRFFSEAIDPTKHLEGEALEINGKVANNTLEQNFIFFVGTLALSTLISSAKIKIIMALAIVFVIARIIFWIGYRIHPLYRAPGMAATSYMNLGILVSVIYLYLSI